MVAKRFVITKVFATLCKRSENDVLEWIPNEGLSRKWLQVITQIEKLMEILKYKTE